MQTTKKHFLLGILLILNAFLFSCKKDRGSKQVLNDREINPSLVYRTPQTDNEKRLILNLKKSTDIIKDVYKNIEALKLVNVAIQSKVYTDQSVKLSDLIYPNEGQLASSLQFKRLSESNNVQIESFAKSFWAIADKMKDVEFTKFLFNLKLKEILNDNLLRKGDLKALSGQKIASIPNKLSNNNEEVGPTDEDGISIYFPYAEQYINPYDNSGNYTPQTSVMTATADADEGYGWKPIINNAGTIISYQEVIINDDYAEMHPTHIIGINGIEVMDPETISNTANFPPGPPVVVPDLPRPVKQVYVGDVRCKKQYYALISFTGNGGGSEIRFTRADGYLKVADGHVKADHFIINGPESISRRDIRKENWTDWTVQWDADWEGENKEQNLAIYEEDNRNSITLSVSLSTKVKVGTAEGTGTIGGTFNFKSDDAIIRQQNHKYDVFFV